MCRITRSNPQVVIEHLSRSGLASGMRCEQIHFVTQNTTTDVVNEGYGAVRVDALDDANVSQAIIVTSIAVSVECVAEEDQVSDCRYLVVMHQAAHRQGSIDSGYSVDCTAMRQEWTYIDTVTGQGSKHEPGTVLSESVSIDAIVRMVQHGSCVRSKGKAEIKNI